MGLLADYVESLPDGTGSFPECQVKEDAFEVIARRTEEEAPEAFRTLRDEWLPRGSSASGWIPEAYANSLTLLFREQVFDDDASCLAAFTANNMELFSKPVYRVIMFARAAGASDVQMPLLDESAPGRAVWDLRYA